MQSLLLIQTGEAPDPVRAQFGGFAAWFRAAMRLQPAQMRVVRIDEGEALPRPDDVSGAVISGSAAMVTERTDWSERTADWIRAAMEAQTPLFGVCYGHQLMAYALGGEVGWLPGGREMGTQMMMHGDHSDTGVARGLPASFPAHTTHRQAVLAPPPGAEVLAWSERDPHQLLRYAPNAMSTQFHPEFTAACMRAYIDARADVLREEGVDVAAMRDAVRETEAARALLERFAHAALAWQQVAVGRVGSQAMDDRSGVRAIK
ncbi:MAG TPA: glutamine amidotransferase [Rhodanobacteraceae bacterium]|nr:glutamine amidotransferase [Rhodanobacteraceae bacterium]